MLISPAYAQAAGAPANDIFVSMMPLLLIFVVFYFLLIRPQQRRMKAHKEMIGAVKRGDTVVLSSGIVGKVTAVGDTEATVEIAPNTPVKVVKGMIGEVRVRGEPAAANDKLVK